MRATSSIRDEASRGSTVAKVPWGPGCFATRHCFRDRPNEQRIINGLFRKSPEVDHLVGSLL